MGADTPARWNWGDVALATGAAIFVVSVTLGIESEGERGVDALAVVVMLTASLSLAARQRAPRAVLAAVTAALVVYTVREYVGGPVYLTLAVALYSLASTRDRRDVLVPAATAVAVLVVAGLVTSAASEWTWHVVVFPPWAAAAVFLGDARRNRREYLRGLEERARWLEESREEETRRRVAEERLRIARDLHDALAHSIATITLQSGVAAHVLDRKPEAVAESLEAIRRTSRAALHELKATLDVLRADDGDADSAPRHPTPGLRQVDTLAASAAHAGLPVDVRRLGGDGEVPTAVDVAAYRIVQESLTNVMRHAGAAQAVVTITRSSDAVTVEVVDDGRGAAAATSGGHGIAGMRERATMVGGTFEAGPRPGGGFRVTARLPLFRAGSDQAEAGV
jgi:signal transduction histidine kinase